jgi:putative DNA primase/helicase
MKVTTQRSPSLTENKKRGKKTGVDDYGKQKGRKELEKKLEQAEAEPTVGGEIKLVGRCLADVVSKDVEYLWYPWLPLGMLTALDGHSSEGKTFVALSIAAALSQGHEPNSNKKLADGPVNTVYLSRENPPEQTTKPRFVAMDGDPYRMHLLDSAKYHDGGTRSITLEDVNALEIYLQETHARLIIFDPLQSYIGSDVDMNRSNQTRPILDKLIALAERMNLCVLVIRHLAKGDNGGRSEHRGLGGVDIFSAMRSVLMVGSAPGDKVNRALVHAKNNVGPLGKPIGYVIESGKGDGISTGKLRWTGQTELTTNSFVATGENRKNKTQVERAREYLREALADGPRLMTELAEGGEFTERVLQTASAGMVEKHRRGGKHGPVEWGLLGPRKFDGRREKP